MTKEEKTKAIEDIIYLCRCAVNSQVPDKTIVSTCNLDHLYEVASRHMLSAMVGLAIESAGIEDKNFKYAIYKCQRKTIILIEEKRRVFEKLDQANIWHMALKGTVLRDWYPKFGMRESADCDILFDRSYEEQVKDIMVGLGYEVSSYGHGHHDVYLKAPLTNMQMHVELFGVGFEKRLNDYYRGVKDRLVKKAGSEYEFTPEDFYIYVLAHNHRDYITGGTGLRSLLDTYIILNHFDFDWEYVKAETEKLKIRDFEEENRSLAVKLFGEGAALTENEKKRLAYMVDAGVHGTLVNRVNNKIERSGGGVLGWIRYIVERLIVPLNVVKHSYPTFYKYKVLLPFLPFYRIIRGMKRNKMWNEIKVLKTSLKWR